jgi:asparagine synthase (glutamine-hydrolysing)
MGSLVEGDRTSGSSWRLSILEAGDFGAMNAVARRAFGLRREDPTADRRLIELCLSIPDEAFAPNGMRRELYRYAFRNDLPAELLNQRGRGLQCSDFLQLFEQWLPEWARELDRLEGSSIAAKVFDLPRMRRMLEDWPRIVAGNRAHADQLYNYTFGGGMALARTLRRYEERRAERPASHS